MARHQQPPRTENYSTNAPRSAANNMPRRANHTEAPVEIEYTTDHLSESNNDNDVYDGPVDLDELFMPSNLEATASDDGSLFGDDDEAETLPLAGREPKYFNNPHKRVSTVLCCSAGLLNMVLVVAVVGSKRRDCAAWMNQCLSSCCFIQCAKRNYTSPWNVLRKYFLKHSSSTTTPR